ncbi:MAG: hypothetical protein Q7S79_00055 [bacterium]|nr:hypothetical protein [bacterium]
MSTQAEITVGERSSQEQEIISIDSSRLEVIGGQVRGLKNAADRVYGVCDLVRADAVTQRLIEVAVEMEQLAEVLGFAVRNPGAYIDLQPRYRMYKVSAGAYEATVDNFQMLTSCFYPKKRVGRTEILDGERDVFLRKLMDGKSMRFSYKTS